MTKEKKSQIKKIKIKGREFKIKSYFEGIARFNFKELCNQNIGAEDYIKISECCSFVLIENIPVFKNENLNKKQRFITLIDIFYEKRIPLMITSLTQLKNMNTNSKLHEPFKRTVSRIHELTSPKVSMN